MFARLRDRDLCVFELRDRISNSVTRTPYVSVINSHSLAWALAHVIASVEYALPRATMKSHAATELAWILLYRPTLYASAAIHEHSPSYIIAKFRFNRNLIERERAAYRARSDEDAKLIY